MNFSNNKEKVNLIKSIALGISIPVIASIIWLLSSSSPLNELSLITKGKMVRGYITKVEEQSEEVSYNNDRSSGIRYYYTYEYNFKLPTGTKITSFGSEDGEIPEHLLDLNSDPYEVDVEYISSNPKISRVKEMESSNKTIWAWLRHRFALGAIVLIFLIFFGGSIISQGIKAYKVEKHANQIT